MDTGVHGLSLGGHCCVPGLSVLRRQSGTPFNTLHELDPVHGVLNIQASLVSETNLQSQDYVGARHRCGISLSETEELPAVTQPINGGAGVRAPATPEPGTGPLCRL